MEKLVEYRQTKSKRASFEVSAAKVGTDPKEEGGRTYEQIKLFIHQNKSGDDFLSLEDIKLVEYDFDNSFGLEDRICTNASASFEVKLWAHNNFDVKCTLFFKNGSVEEIPAHINILKP